MYHRIQCEIPEGNTNGSLFVCPERLDAHMAELKSRGWGSITADQLAEHLINRTCPPFKTFVISVDDGALDGYTNGAPIWESHGYRATFYMVVGKAGDYLVEGFTGDKPHFSWDQARDLVARGHGIGNHTWSHSSIANAGPTKLDSQVRRAQDELIAQLGFAPRTFVYPYGSTSATAAAYIRDRFDLAFTTKSGADESTDPALAPRIRVSRTTGPIALADTLSKFREPCL